MHVFRWIAKITLPLVILAAGAFAMNRMVSSKPEVDRRPAREQAYAVNLQVIEPANFQPNITLYGTVAASRSVDLRALVSGEVIWVNPALAEGQLIEQGAVMVRIDPFDYEGGVREATANLAEARAKLTETTASIASEEATLERLKEQQEFAKRDLERAEKLVKSGSLTNQALDNRKLVLSQRQQAVEARANNLTVLKARIEQQNANAERLAWRLEQAKRNLADTELKAPFTGLVQKKNVDLGRSVSGNDTLVSMYDPAQMDVRFTLSDAQYGRLIAQNEQLEGRKIKVNWKLGSEVRTHDATIDRITPEVNAAFGGIEVFARIAADANLRAGTFVELQVPDRTYENAVSIPQAALYTNNVVYLAVEGRMQPKSVGVLAYLGETVLIDAKNLEAGALIVATRVAEAGEGLKVVDPNRMPKAKAAKKDRSADGKKNSDKNSGKKSGKQAKAADANMSKGDKPDAGAKK